MQLQAVEERAGQPAQVPQPTAGVSSLPPHIMLQQVLHQASPNPVAHFSDTRPSWAPQLQANALEGENGIYGPRVVDRL